MPWIPSAVAPDKLVHQFAQAGGQIGLGADTSLQPFTHGIADGTARPVIKLFWIAVDLGLHGYSLGGSTSQQRSQGLSGICRDKSRREIWFRLRFVARRHPETAEAC